MGLFYFRRKFIQQITTAESAAQADLRRKSSSFSLQPQSEQLRQQKIKTPTPTVTSTANRVPNENKEWVSECMLLNLLGGTGLLTGDYFTGCLIWPKLFHGRA
jgi:hypothetical protein